MQKLNWLGLPFLGDEARPCHQSDANNFRRCPRQHAFKRVREARELPPEFLALITVKGRVYHELVEDLGHILIGDDADVANLFDARFRDALGRPLADEEESWLEKEAATAARIYRGLVERRDWAPPGADLVGTELKFNYRWAPKYKHKFHFAGRIDALFRDEAGYHLRDFKSGSRFPACVTWDLQLGVYGTAVELGALEGVPAGPVVSRGVYRLQDCDVYKQGGKNGAAGDYCGPGLYPADPSVIPAMVMEHEVYPLLLEIREREKTGRFQGGSRDRNDCSWCGQRAACEAMMDIQKPEEAFLGELRRELG